MLKDVNVRVRKSSRKAKLDVNFISHEDLRHDNGAPQLMLEHDTKKDW